MKLKLRYCQKIMGNVLEATILNGKFEGEVVLPRIPMHANFAWPIICGVFSRWKTVKFIHLYFSGSQK